MLGKIKINEELELLASLKTLAQAYEEISVMRMQKARVSVLKTRDFMAELALIFHEIRISYKDQIEKLLKEKKIPVSENTSSTNPKNSRQAAVLISPSAKLYGDITRKVFNLFVSQTKNTDTDLIIVGKQGKALYDSLPNRKNYTFIDLPEEQITVVNLMSVIIQTFMYQKVTLYFGKFVNVINQEPQATDISGTAPLPNQEENTQNEEIHNKYLFEPTLEEILSFFETQIFTSLFQQTLEESQLARYASRITAMEDTLGNIEVSFKGLTNQKRRIQNSLSNRKQLETISGISLWGN